MADGTRDNEDRKDPASEEAALSARLARLGDRLGQVEASRTPTAGPGPTADRSAFARGIRLSSELVGGVILGAALGWVLDRWLGTSPGGLIVFLLLGFAAGILNVMRAAGVVAERGSGTKPPS